MSRAITGTCGRAVVLGLLAVALSGVTAAAAEAPPKSARVTVNDFFYAPTTVTVRKGGAVNWVWSAENVNSHDVHLKSGPKGLENKRSYSTATSAATEARFRKAFERPGTYRYFCTIHPTKMRMTVVVRG
jgi:plastocyanin